MLTVAIRDARGIYQDDPSAFGRIRFVLLRRLKREVAEDEPIPIEAWMHWHVMPTDDWVCLLGAAQPVEAARQKAVQAALLFAPRVAADLPPEYQLACNDVLTGAKAWATTGDWYHVFATESAYYRLRTATQAYARAHYKLHAVDFFIALGAVTSRHWKVQALTDAIRHYAYINHECGLLPFFCEQQLCTDVTACAPPQPPEITDEDTRQYLAHAWQQLLGR